MLVRWLLLVVGAYLVGAIPTGALVARAHGVDLTQYGSRRTGATNALRVLGKRAAVLVLLGDALKGGAAVWLARRVDGEAAAPLAALAAMLGHSYSVFLGGRGGRGVATGLGALLALSPRALVAGAVVGLPTIAATRLVSLGSLLGSAAGAGALAAEVAQGRAPRGHLAFAVGGAAFLYYTHRDNIERLLAGTERRFGERVAVHEELTR